MALLKKIINTLLNVLIIPKCIIVISVFFEIKLAYNNIPLH